MKRVRSQRIGILGGTFNPIHIGHLLIAQDAMEQAQLDRVVFIPDAHPPHKSVAGLVSSRRRLHMVKLAIRGDHRFVVDDIEIRRGGKSYAVDTVTELKHRWPHAELFFIIGTDSLQELHLWRDIERLAAQCTFLVLARPGCAWNRPRLRRSIHWQLVRGHPYDIASRDIRARIARRQSIRYLVPDAVLNYIERKKLYR
ncbi:MAG: nicotinate-nucleotide adenylyltransferase [Verrucomicrobiia bacterium]